MKNYRKTQQLYKLLGLFKKTHKKQQNKILFWLEIVFYSGIVIFFVLNAIYTWLTNYSLLPYLSLLGILISSISAMASFFIYSLNFLRFKKYKKMNISIIACEDVNQTTRYTSILKKYFTQPFLEEKLLELDFQIQTKNTRLIPFILAVSFIFSSLTLLKEIDISLLQDFFNVIRSPSNISQMLLQYVTIIFFSFSTGIGIGILAVKRQTYKYTYWTKLLKLTIQLIEHEKKYKTIQVNSTIDDSNNSTKWKQKIITWLQK